MKITLREIHDATPVFSQLLTKRVDFKTSYRLNKILAQVQIDLKMINDTRMEMIKTHSGIIKENNFEFPDGEKEKFIEEFNEFLKTETEIVSSPIPQECMEKFEMSALEIGLIIKFIEVKIEVVNNRQNGSK